MQNPVEFTDPRRAAEAIVDRVGREIVLAIPVGIGKPNLLVNALYDLAQADASVKLRILTGLSLVRPRYKSDLERRFVAPLLERQFATYPDLAYAEAMRSGSLPPNIEVHEFFLQAGQWLSSAAMQQSYASLSYSHVAAHLIAERINVMAQLMAPSPDPASTQLSLASNPDISLDLKTYVETQRAAGRPIVVAGELNANMPYMPGQAEIARSDLDLVLTPPAPHFDLFAPPKEPVTLADYAMALHAATLIRDGGTLQIGIGSFSDALTHALILRHTRNAEFRALIGRLGAPLPQGAELGTFQHGLYGCSELLVDGFLALRRAGILKRHVNIDGRDIVVHAGFFLGNRAFYDELKSLPADALAAIGMTAISYTNTLRGDAAMKTAQRSHARFVNSALVVTLLGAVSSDALDDGRVVSGIGGQGDFVAQAHELPGARSIIAVRATRGSGSKTSSNVVWRHANVSIPRQLRDIVVTEYGIADIRGRSDREVVEALLTIADSRFQPILTREATAVGKISSNFQLPAHAANNTPEDLAAVLGPARRSGLLPVFPIGTEMTDTEQALVPVLGALRQAGTASILRMLWTGAGLAALSQSEAAAIDRLGLTTPATWKETAMRALVLGSLRQGIS
jgi:acyl-CoA hydrolase